MSGLHFLFRQVGAVRDQGAPGKRLNFVLELEITKAKKQDIQYEN